MHFEYICVFLDFYNFCLFENKMLMSIIFILNILYSYITLDNSLYRHIYFWLYDHFVK